MKRIIQAVFILCFFTYAGAVTAPESITITAFDSKVYLEWDKSADAGVLYYNVYRSTNTVFAESDLGWQIYGTKFFDYSAANLIQYNYWIRPVTAILEDISQVKSAIPFAPPFTPAGAAYQNTASGISLTWTASVRGSYDVLWYDVYRSVLQITAADKITRTAELNYYDTGLVSGLKYNYQIYAGDSASNSPTPYSLYNILYLDISQPQPPALISVVQGSIPGTLKLQWSAVSAIPAVTGYNIYRATGPESFDYSAPVITTATAYDDAFVVLGQAYYYTVSGFSSVEGTKSAVVTAIPVSMQVTGLTATAYNNYVYLSWDGAALQDDITGYKIYTSTDPSPDLFTYALQVTGTQNSCNITGLSLLNQPYYLKVSVLNTYGESNTNTASYVDITITATTPAKPENVSAASLSDASIKLSWTAAPLVSGVTSYNVYRSLISGAYNYTQPYSIVEGNSYTDSNVTLGWDYYYEVRAYGDGTESISSVEVTAVSSTPPQPVKNLTGSYVNGKIWLLWNSPDTSYTPKLYRVYRSTTTLFPAQPLSYGTNVTEDKFIDAEISPGAGVYYYKVKTVHNGLEDTDSTVLQISIAPLQQPPGALVALAGDTKVTLIWRMITPLYYNIYRRDEATLSYGPPIAYSVGFSLKDYTDTGLTNGVTYYYMIKAVNSSGEGTASVEVKAKPYVAVKLPADSSITAQIINKKEVLLNWNTAVGSSLAWYIAYRSSDGGGTYTKLASNITDTNYTDISTEWNKTYYYIIKTEDMAGNTDAVYTPVKVVLPLPKNQIKVYKNLMNLALGDTLKLRYILTQSGKIKVRIYTLSGAFVRELVDTDITGTIDAQNPYESADFYWDGKNRAGEKAASGVYIISLETPNSRVIEKVAVVK